MRTQERQTAAARETSAWAHRGARLGFAARGLTYLLLAWLAIEIAVGHPHRQASDSGAFALLAGHTVGIAALVIMAIGFAGYAAWSLTCALRGLRRPHRSGREAGQPSAVDEIEPHAKSGAKRTAWLVRAVVYGFLCYLAFGLATGATHGSSGDPAPLAARAMREPAGQLLVAAAGAIVIIAGLSLAWRASRLRFMDDLRTDEMTTQMRRVVSVLGLVGSVARGLVVVLVGVFLLVSGLTHKPGKAKGLDASLVTLAHQPYGAVLLIGVAAGLAVFGVFSWFEARYIREDG
ncbi:MAG: DUF1206 domain-containing protein [Acidimicrobiaceae bacterium]|nr:DUF1206 domain-containing protein [Acidimicrobiaceae bacterium]